MPNLNICRRGHKVQDGKRIYYKKIFLMARIDRTWKIKLSKFLFYVFSPELKIEEAMEYKMEKILIKKIF